MTRLVRNFLISALVLTVAGAGVGCSSNAGSGALLGGAAGAGLGAIIGNNSHGRTASGAAIGGAVGALSGALIGNEMDKKERDRYDDDRYYEDRYDRRGGYYEERPTYYERERYGHGPRGDGYYESYRETRVYRY